MLKYSTEIYLCTYPYLHQHVNPLTVTLNRVQTDRHRTNYLDQGKSLVIFWLLLKALFKVNIFHPFIFCNALDPKNL